MNYNILVINAGSTSTKLALYYQGTEVLAETLSHSKEDLAEYPDVPSQFQYRKKAVQSFIDRHGISLKALKIVVSRGGTLKPLPGGIYQVNPEMRQDLLCGAWGMHATNLGGIIAAELAEQAGVTAVVVDPPCCDELDELARLSGLPQLPRRSSYHALNQKAILRLHCREQALDMKTNNFIVVHLGGGISVGAHRRGLVVDVNNALDGDGPFAPERSGGLPVSDLVNLCFSGQYTREEMLRMINGRGGLVAYLGTNSAREVEERMEAGDEKARTVYLAMGYQTAKEIGAAAAVLDGDVQGILLTGGIAHSRTLTDYIVNKVRYIAPVFIYPGENEMKSLAEGAWRALQGIEPILQYK